LEGEREKKKGKKGGPYKKKKRGRMRAPEAVQYGLHTHALSSNRMFIAGSPRKKKGGERDDHGGKEGGHAL